MQALLPATHCLKCKTKINAASGNDESTPKANDWSVCFACAALAKFTNEMGLREPTIQEIEEATPEERKKIRQAQEAIVLNHGVVISLLEDTPGNRRFIEQFLREVYLKMIPPFAFCHTSDKG